jgi:UDP-GlcNAc:undecaprenyl-phosphate/decaprenyl-phosphate GlcNAc-1-phosphate transferase
LTRRSNYRGASLLFPLGLPILAAGLIVSEAAGLDAGRWLVYVAGVFLLGLLDDLLGERGPRGLRGHGAELAAGRPTTGALKAVGTIALAAWAAPGTGSAYLAEVGVLSLAPHVANLIDLRPGRVEKSGALALAALCAMTGSVGPLQDVWPLAAAGAAGALLTLRERAMLGDCGASLVGAIVGVAAVAALGAAGTAIALAALITISLYGEFRSISSAIERVPLLERLDSLGRVN